MARVHLVKVGPIDPSVPEFLALSLPASIPAVCTIEPISIDAREAFDASRRQYDATRLLGEVARLGAGAGAGEKYLGIAGVDLFIPVLTFVFGQAQVRGHGAIVSVHRLRQEFYGLPADPATFYRRCEKEAVHEIGHTFGLIHCERWECAMHFSNSIEEIDLKSVRFCPDCSSALRGLVR